MFEFFEHTADLGIRVRSADLETLFTEAALALFSVIVENLSAVEPRMRYEVCLPAEEPEYLLFDWLNKLLYVFDSERMLFSRFEVSITDEGLRGFAWGEALDPYRHQLSHEVKAITYHELKVKKCEDGWLAEVIVDI